MADNWMNEPIRCTLTFDKKDSNGNNLKYIIYMGDDTQDIISNNGIQSLETDDNEAETSGNPLGIMNPNICSVNIYDSNNYLMPTNKNSPYYGYMRNGVSVKLEIAYDNVNYEPLGTYYVTDWSTGWSSGTNDVAEITGKDKLDYLYNIEIPKLPAYSGISIQTLLVNIFIAVEKSIGNYTNVNTLSGSGKPSDSLGNENDFYINTDGIEIYQKLNSIWTLLYYIDKTLDLNMVYGITVGSKLGDVLNSIAQVLIARVVVNNTNVVKIVPALSTYESGSYKLGLEDSEGPTSYHNSSIVYNKVKVKFNQVGNNAVTPIITLYGITLKPGINELLGLKFNSKAIAIEDIYFDRNEIDNEESNVLSNMNYAAYQDGIDITMMNNSTVNIKGDLIIEGRPISAVTASKMADVLGTDTKIANTFTIETDILQDQDKAQKLANDTSEYMEKMSKLIKLNTLLTPRAQTGDKVEISDSDIEEFNGNFKIISAHTVYGTNYTKTVTLLKLQDSILYWDDNGIWLDSDEGGIWKE